MTKWKTSASSRSGIGYAQGTANVLLVLTEDHGVAPVPSEQAKRGMPRGHNFVNPADIVGQSLNNRFGVRDLGGRIKTLPGDWVLASIDNSLYFAGVTTPEVIRPGIDPALTRH